MSRESEALMVVDNSAAAVKRNISELKLVLENLANNAEALYKAADAARRELT